MANFGKKYVKVKNLLEFHYKQTKYIQAVYFRFSFVSFVSFPKLLAWSNWWEATGPDLPPVLPSAISTAFLRLNLDWRWLVYSLNHNIDDRKDVSMVWLPWAHRRWQRRHRARWMRSVQVEGSNRLEGLPDLLGYIFKCCWIYLDTFLLWTSHV